MNNKKIIAIALIALTVVIGGAAIFIGIRLSQPTTPIDTNAYVAGNDGIKYLFFCPNGEASVYWNSTKGTYCMRVPSPQGFASKHWCDTSSWLNNGCNCPSTASCDTQHEMADGSIYQQGQYSPSSAQCACYHTSITAQCANATASNACSQNLFQQPSNFPQEICLDRIRGDRSKTYCGLQQIDLSWVPNSPTTGCFLSGLMSAVPECQTVQEVLIPCGDSRVCTKDGDCEDRTNKGILQVCDQNGVCTDTSTTENLDVECDEKIDSSLNRCALTSNACPAGYTPFTEVRNGVGVCGCRMTQLIVTTPVVTTPVVTTPVVTTPVVTTPVVTTPVVTTPVVTTPVITTVVVTTPVTTPPTTPPTTTIIPETALISDEADRMIIGIALLAIGLVMYKSGLYLNVGNLLWNSGGSQVWGGISGTGSAVNNTFSRAWGGLVEADSNVEGFFMKLGFRFKALLKLIGNFFLSIYDKISLLVLTAVSKVLGASIWLVKTVKTLDRFINRISGRIKNGPKKTSSFEQRILEESEKD